MNILCISNNDYESWIGVSGNMIGLDCTIIKSSAISSTVGENNMYNTIINPQFNTINKTINTLNIQYQTYNLIQSIKYINNHYEIVIDNISYVYSNILTTNQQYNKYFNDWDKSFNNLFININNMDLLDFYEIVNNKLVELGCYLNKWNNNHTFLHSTSIDKFKTIN